MFLPAHSRAPLGVLRSPRPRPTPRLLLLGALMLGASAPRFGDSFDTRLDPGWAWLRENPAAWRLRDGALEIRLEPGAAETVRNALVRPAPDRRQGRVAIEVTVRNLTPPTQPFEQAGLTWYNDGQPVFKLVKELVDGQLMIIPGRAPMTNETVQLRLVVGPTNFVAQFRPGASGAFQTAATGPLPPAAREEISLQGYHGPPDAEHWIRFDDFRVLPVGE